MKGLYNNQGRKSGGYRKFKIPVVGDRPTKPTDKVIGLLCSWGYHNDCRHKNENGVCVCECHKKL